MNVTLPEQFNDIDVQRKRLLESVQTHLAEHTLLIQEVILLAEHAHAGQQRDDGYPYVIHPIRVARTLVEEMGEYNPNVIAAALLHDVVEDTDVTLMEVERQFGGPIAMLVDSVTRPRAKEETEQDKLTTKPKNYQKILESSEETLRIKAADILDNMRGWLASEEIIRSHGKLSRWLREAREWYIQIGEKVGYGIAQQMRQIVTYFEA